MVTWEERICYTIQSYDLISIFSGLMFLDRDVSLCTEMLKRAEVG